MIPEQVQPQIQDESVQKSQICQDQHNTYQLLEGSSYFIAKTGHWTYEEKVRYLLFIQHNLDHLDYHKKEQEVRVFKNMSGFIRTRRSHQCRYHHNKMQSYFGTIPSIISYYQDNLSVHQIIRQKYQQDLEKFSLMKYIPSSNLEECHLNNENHEEKIENYFQRKKERRRTSILVADQKDNNSQTVQKTLQKTEQTIKTQSLDSYKFMFFDKGSQADKIKQNALVIEEVQNANLEKIFQINLQSSKTLQKHVQWLQCKHLYELWRSKVEFLLQPQH